ncbi:adaptor complexes medium subunit family [Plasmodium sp. DRC-Itaito]|nr:adaptor complexes medium subunit family [Plasmodium sp. DRC-Itaito]
MVDLFCIYSSHGKLLIEQCFNKERYKRNVHNFIKRILHNKTNNNNNNNSSNHMNNNGDNNYYLILNNTSYDYRNDKLHLLNGRCLDDKKFVYIIKNDELYFVTLIEGENNPILIIEMMQEIIKIIKKYFNIDKLKENILIHNYTIINFLINEILVQNGKPALFIHTILKELIEYDNNSNNNNYYNFNYNTNNNFLNETLKIGPIPNNLYNLITQNKYININVGNSINSVNNMNNMNNINNNSNGNLVMLNINNEKNINYSYSNGSYLNGKHPIYNYWRSYNQTYTSSNEIYIDVEENVNCIVNKNNKIIHYYIQGNVYINSNINGSPHIKLYFNQLDIQKCNFHYTINRNKLFYKNKDQHNDNNKNIIIHFVPLHEKYCLLHYYDKILLHPAHASAYKMIEYHNKNNIKSKTHFNHQENINNTITNVLSLTTVEDIIKDNENKNHHHITNHNNIIQKNNSNSFESSNINVGYVEKNMNIQNNINISNNNYIEYNNNFQLNNILNIYNNENFNITQNYFHIPNDNCKNSYDNNLFSHPKYKLPILIKGNVQFVSTENMYKIKLNVLLNNINTNKNNSNILLNRYENILIKMPIHHFIKSVNFHTSLGNINYNEKKKCIYWFINYLTDMNTQIYANISLYVPTHEENDMNQINNINQLKNTYHLSPLNNFNLYPLFNFVAYASLKINGVSITDHKIEKIEIQNMKNMEIRKGCRYTTIYNNIEFRL